MDSRARGKGMCSRSPPVKLVVMGTQQEPARAVFAGQVLVGGLMALTGQQSLGR